MKNFKEKYLRYSETKVPEDCVFKISPSSFAVFVSHPHNWYRQQVLKENVFKGNTSSVIGTIVHAIAEVIAKKEEVDVDSINEYIDSFKDNEDVDIEVVRSSYTMMAECLVNDYVLQHDFLEVETSHLTQLWGGYYTGGTVDRLEGTKMDTMIVDYKSYNSKTKPKSIPLNYKIQLLDYARILKNKGYNPQRIRLVYINRYIDGGISEKTGKALKSYPPEVTVLTESITEEDYEFIDSLLSLCVDSMEASIKYPELRHVIFHDNRLKLEK